MEAVNKAYNLLKLLQISLDKPEILSSLFSEYLCSCSGRPQDETKETDE